ncbi:MAG TPA: ABC transporter permease [Vicinamibacterales bacterium]
MTWWRDLIERVRLLIFRRREDRELREELQFHIDMETAHRSRAGLDPVEARRRSLLALGGLEQTYAHARDARGTGLIEDFGRDMHFTLRMMRRSPGFTAAAVFMLALGTGANAAIFSVLDAVILHSPFREPDRIVMVHELVPRQTAGIPLSHLERIRVLPIFTAVGSLWSGSAILTGAGDVRHETLECVTAGVFEALGTPTLLGRVLTEVDDRPGSDPVVVVSHRFWRDDLGGDPAVIGRRIGLDGTSATIVGVMPPRFLGPFSRNAAEMWAPLGPALHGSSPVGCRSTMMVNVFARLKPGLLLGSANALAGGSQAVADLPSDRGTKGARLLLVGLDDRNSSAPLYFPV